MQPAGEVPGHGGVRDGEFGGGGEAGAGEGGERVEVYVVNGAGEAVGEQLEALRSGWEFCSAWRFRDDLLGTYEDDGDLGKEGECPDGGAGLYKDGHGDKLRIRECVEGQQQCVLYKAVAILAR